MIVEMKKLILIMPNIGSEMEAEITKLGHLGVMHVAPFHTAKDKSIERVIARIQQLEKAITVLESQEFGASSETIHDYHKMEHGDIQLVERVIQLDQEMEAVRNQIDKQRHAHEWYSQWGQVAREDLADLEKHGVQVKLFALNAKDLKSLKESHQGVYVVGESNGLNLVALLLASEESNIAFTEEEFPEFPAATLAKRMEETQAQRVAIENELSGLKAQISVLIHALKERKRRLDVRNVQYGGLAIDEHAQCFKGYLPIDKVTEFVAVADENQWGYVIDDPAEEDVDEIPTQVRSPRWVDRIRPVMNFMGLVPGYKELDVSKVFMLFFTFFTGILVGDAGYGLIFLLLTFIMHAKQKFKKQIEFELFYVMSISVMFWGTLTGTYFGAETIANIPFLKQLIVTDLASFGGDTLFTQKFMFLIGAIHLSVGHLQLAWKYSNSVKAISELGWVAIVWGLYLIVNQMVLGIEAPDAMLWLFVGGTALVAFFSNPGGNFFNGMLSSIGNLPLSIINGFSDVISYIRLYAVGLSTVLMASSFNQMAIGEGVSTVFAMIGAVIILVLGHGLNMILAAMAVLVHGVRLNMLEYAGHANVEFSGSEYNPFKIKSNK